MGKRTAQKDTIIDTTSDSQVNSNVPYMWSPAEEEKALEAIVESLHKTCTRYKMEISAEKTKLMTNSHSGIQREIKVKRKKVDTITSVINT